MGVSRAMHQDFVHVATDEYEKNLMLHARQYGERPMCSGGDTFNYADVDLEDDSNDLALYFNDPDEVPAVSVLSLMNAVEATPVVAHAPGPDADINQFFDYEGVFEDIVGSDSDMDM